MKHAAGERHSRFIKGNERNELKNSFIKAQTNHRWYIKQRKLNCQVRQWLLVTEQVVSGGRQLSQMDKDLVKSLEKVRQKLIKEEASRECPPDPAHGGFVHSISYRPLIVHMWIEDQIRLWHHRCGDGISYLGATGTIVANHNGKRVLYHGLVVRG